MCNVAETPGLPGVRITATLQHEHFHCHNRIHAGDACVEWATTSELASEKVIDSQPAAISKSPS